LPVTGSASNANLTATLTAGVLTGITIVSGGSGYAADAGIWIPGGTRNATVTLTVSGGAITGFNIVDGGAYSFTPTILTRGDTSPVWLPYYV
jgi:hypothetical protein